MRGPALAAGLLVWATLAPAQEDGQLSPELREGRQLFEGVCAACHSLDLPRSQRLTRADWEWVLEDMVEKFGCPIDAEQQALILEYLVEFHGPGS